MFMPMCGLWLLDADDGRLRADYDAIETKIAV